MSFLLNYLSHQQLQMKPNNHTLVTMKMTFRCTAVKLQLLIAPSGTFYFKLKTLNLNKKVPDGANLRVAGALLRCDEATRGRVREKGTASCTGRVGGLPWEIFRNGIPGDAFRCIFSDKKCILVGTVHN